MDPNETWKEIQELVESGKKQMLSKDDTAELAQKLSDLSEWIERGGSPPWKD